LLCDAQFFGVRERRGGKQEGKRESENVVHRAIHERVGHETLFDRGKSAAARNSASVREGTDQTDHAQLGSERGGPTEFVRGAFAIGDAAQAAQSKTAMRAHQPG
jgi:hypothetical protein